MTFYEIFQLINDNLPIFTVFLILILSCIEVSKIKFNPWSWIGSIIFKRIIEELKSDKNEILNLKDDIKELGVRMDRYSATTSRYRILRFNDEALHGKKHTQEHFDQILTDIDEYENFCKSDPGYKNNKGKMAMENIKNIYKKCNQDNSFL